MHKVKRLLGLDFLV